MTNTATLAQDHRENQRPIIDTKTASETSIPVTASDDTECIANNDLSSSKKHLYDVPPSNTSSKEAAATGSSGGANHFKKNLFGGAFHRIPRDTFSVPNAGKFAGLSLQKIKGEFEKAANEVLSKAQAVPQASPVQQNDSFRGRYVMSPQNNSGKVAVASISSPIHSPSTQVSKILQSREGAHVESVMRSLLKSKDEYMILLGPGPLGAYLKDVYKPSGTGAIGKNGRCMGVYVDYIIPRGAAERSGLVDIGDRIIKVGENDVTQESIHTVPQMIANSPRPLVVVMSRAQIPSNPPSAIDIAIEYVYRVQDEAARLANESSLSSMPLFDAHSSSNSCNSSHSDEPETSCLSSSSSEDPNDREKSLLQEQNYPVHLNGFQRRSEKRSFTALSRAVARDPEFRDILRKSFIECCLDPRRLPFITSYVAGEDEATMKMESHIDNMQSRAASESIKLMFWLEVQSFKDMWDFTPASRRRDHAKRIFEKFLSDNSLQNEALELLNSSSLIDENVKTLSPDMFNLRTRFVHTDVLIRTEEVISDTAKPLTVNILNDCQEVIENDLCGARFASFLDSDEGARMRAYLMAATPFVKLPIKHIFEASIMNDTNALLYMQYMLIHLLGEGVPGGLSAAYHIRKRLLPKLAKFDDNNVEELNKAMTVFWQLFLSPDYGALDRLIHSSYCEKAITSVREYMFKMWPNFENKNTSMPTTSDLAKSLNNLADELLCDYVMNFGPKFKQDRIYSHLCEEIAANRDNKEDPTLMALPKSCINRLLRKLGVPPSISMHRQLYSDSLNGPNPGPKEGNLRLSQVPTNAEYAVVFGSEEVNDEGDEDLSNDSNDLPHNNLKRFCAAPISAVIDRSLINVLGIPSPLEKYAFAPPKRRSPFVDFSAEKSADGWEVSLNSFVVPHSSPDFSNGCVYGVSLVLQRNTYISHYRDLSLCLDELPINEIARVVREPSFPAHIEEEITPFKGDLCGHIRSSQFHKNGDTVGLSLISSSNCIPSMRELLSLVFNDLVNANRDPVNRREFYLDTTADLIYLTGGNENLLRAILQKYMCPAKNPWIDKQLNDQVTFCETNWDNMLLNTLSPVSLALTFSTILLEQKVVFFSSRRSLLLGCVKSASSYIEPLEWPHLLVPLVPNDMVNDLLEYPGPFIVGVTSDNPDGNDWINDLQNDVTLVDLDIGRVILAEVVGDRTNDESRLGGLRTQILYLSEELGRYIGHAINPNEWACDQALNFSIPPENNHRPKIVRDILKRFIHELLSGIDSCSLWIEEKNACKESTVLFDEDRFFHLKNVRADKKKTLPGIPQSKSRQLALSVDEFDLVLETFLRGQGLSTYISSQDKERMLYW